MSSLGEITLNEEFLRQINSPFPSSLSDRVHPSPKQREAGKDEFISPSEGRFYKLN
jgi:hypothetical protein